MLLCAIREVKKDSSCRFKRTEPITVGLSQVRLRLRHVLKAKALDGSLEGNEMVGFVDVEEGD